MVQDVKKLGAKLNVERLRDSFDFGVLDGCEIEIEQPRPDHSVSPGISKQVHAGPRDLIAIAIESLHAHSGERSGHQRNAEAFQLEIIIDIAGVHGITASRACQAGCESFRIGTALTQGIPSNPNRTRRTGTGIDDSTEFPAAKNMLCDRSPKLWRGKLP